MEKDLLALVLTLKEYEQMLRGARIIAYTDHKNLTFKTFSIQRILRWRLFLDEFDLDLRYIEGSKNVLADCFSRLPIIDNRSAAVGNGTQNRKRNGRTVDFTALQIPKDDETINDETFFLEDDTEVVECLLNLPQLQEMPNPITTQNIANHQYVDDQLHANAQRTPQRYPVKVIGGVPLITYIDNVQQPDQWKICLPESLIGDVITWYHRVLGHPGSQRLYLSVSARFYSTNLRKRVEEYRCPDSCEQYKNMNRQYGHLPPRFAHIVPWHMVAVDLIGPWTIKLADGNEITFRAVTCIDPVTNLVEIIRINNKLARHVAEQFENCWLSRYPSPNYCISDNGAEFIGADFVTKLGQHGIQHKKTTTKNPRSNGVCERMHKTIADIIRVRSKVTIPDNEEQANQIIDNALATCMHVQRCAVNHALMTSPGALVFGRDMFVDVPLMASLETIRDRRQQQIDNNLRRANTKRIDYNYQVGEYVWIRVEGPDKLDERMTGPHKILQAYTNGTVRLSFSPDDMIYKIFNIRKIIPYKGPPLQV